MQTKNTLPHTIQPLQLNKKASQQTQTQHPSRAWILDKALVSHLPLVLLLWSTCWLLTGCDLQTSRTSGPLLQTEPTRQDSQISCQSLTVKSDQETFRQFFIEHEATAIWEKLLCCLQNPPAFGDPYAIILKYWQISRMLSQHANPIQEQLKAAIKLYIESQEQLGLLSIDDFSEEAFHNFLATNELQSVWQSLQKQRGSHLIQVRGMLKACTPLVRTRVVKGLVQFIGTYSPDLDTLDLSDNGLTELPDIFENFGKLQLVMLRNNPLTELPVSLQKGDFVRTGPSLTQEEEAFRQLLFNNDLHEIWLRLERTRLKDTLDLSRILRCNQALKPRVLEGVVRFICKHCPELIELDLSDNGLTTLPDSFKDLTRLQILNLSDNPLKTLPVYFKELPNLKVVTGQHSSEEERAFMELLSTHRLSQLARKLKIAQDTLALNEMLQDLSETMQTRVLEGVVQYICKHCPDLIALDLSDNGLKALPDIFKKLTKLQRLDLSYNKLQALPDTFVSLKSLKILNLDNNQLKQLPNSFGDLTQLQILNLHHNYLINLPQSFAKLTQLQRLDLYHNNLTELPDIFAKLTNLQILDLDNNKLTTLPLSCRKFINLPECSVDNNLLQCITQDITFRYLLVANRLDSVWKKLDQERGKDRLDLSGMLRCNPAQQPHVLDGLVQFIGRYYPDLVELNLSSNGLKALPDNFGNLTKLERLYLYDNQLTTLPANFVDLTQLQVINLSNNNLTTLPDNLGELTKLHELYLSNNKLKALPDSCGNLTQLKAIELRNNQLTTLPLSCYKLTNFKRFIVDNNLLQCITEDITFQNLLVANRLDSVWKKLEQERGKDRLDLSGMLRCNPAVKIEVLDGLVRFIGRYYPDLVDLNLSRNGLQALPYNFGNLTKLERLCLYDNQLQVLSATFGSLKKLNYLDLSENKLTKLPESFANLTQLNYLDLSYNKLQALPDTFVSLKSLKILYLNKNQLKVLPYNFGNLIKLEILGLNNNKLTALPDNFGNLIKLERLNLSNNQLKALPDSFGSLENLEVLYLNNNQLTTLPANLGELTKLHELYLNNNQLTTLPDNFGNLTQLQAIELRNNPLTTLPLSCRKLINLKLCIVDNKLLQRLKDDIAFWDLLVVNQLDSV